MKNAINYYYHLSSDDIRQFGNQYFFHAGGYSYALIPYYNGVEIEDVYKMHLGLLQRGVYCHQIIANEEKHLLTNINNTPYVLMRIYVEATPITVQDILLFSTIPLPAEERKNLKRDTWSALWSEKIDYFEYQLSQSGKKYPLIRGSFSYFSGLTETAIQLINSIQENTTTKRVIAHKRVRSNDTLLQLYNPLNLIADLKIRDISEYYKDLYFKEQDIWTGLEQYFLSTPLTQYEYILFFARMLYPSYYFDIYENILLETEEEQKLQLILDKIEGYEKILKKLYRYLQKITVMPEIEWLIKM